ncbi:MAG: DNA-directed RNA polymerase subunit omega [Ruminococcaceae bacterium]|nr:DNA-directed RNA polymerase subunit omega [Oscillospiraceae bacterium]
MIFKEFQGLVNKAGSRYGLIISVTKRARDIQDKIIRDAQEKGGKDADKNPAYGDYQKPVSIATREFADGKLNILKNDEE